jgi:YHS domain-containing protein
MKPGAERRAMGDTVLSRSPWVAFAAVLTLAGAGLGVASPALAAKPAVYTAPFSKLAVEGYDLVSYFQPGGPKKGLASFATVREGVEYRFASAANLAAFRASPSRYLPSYGGYCAWAVSQGYTAKGDPLAWRVVGGRLYLNYDAKVQARWNQDVPGHIARADGNWPKVLK